MIKVSFVIVEYNSIDDILNCISTSEINKSEFEYEIIVSSNSLYPMDKCAQLKFEYEDLIWIFNEKNGGFAYAMNQGLRRAQGDVLIIMNPDVEILSGFGKMVEFMYSHDNVGAIAPQIIDSNRVIQDSCRKFITPVSFIKRHLKRFYLHRSALLEPGFDYDKIQTVDWVIGAFIMVSRKVYLQTGGLDETYFLYCEDMDWCTRIRQLGYQVVYYPDAVIQYVGSRSARESIKYSRIFIKSLIHYWHKFGFFFISSKDERVFY